MTENLLGDEMTKEVYIDGIGNISVQGPVVTLSLTREPLGSNTEGKTSEEIIHLTMTGQNLIKITNILNNTLKRLAQRSQETTGNDKAEESSQPKSKIKKDKTVN